MPTSLAAYTDANRWLDGTKIKFDTEASSTDDRLKAEPIVEAALIDLYPDNVLLWFFLLIGINRALADNYPINKNIDIRHYQFNISLSDQSNRITATALITVLCKQSGIKEFRLDLINKPNPENGKGMVVESVSLLNKAISYVHVDNALLIQLPLNSIPNTEMTFTIKYSGEPADGLKIGPTKYGDRSFFSDDWPNKARNWLPTIDHPSDKATCEFIVKAPGHYKVVSNGLLMEESSLNDSTKLTHWKQSVPISSWLYTLGVADFAATQYCRYYLL